MLTEQTDTGDKWLKHTERIIKGVEKTSIEKRRWKHYAWWNNFWNRSWIRVSGDDGAETVTRGYTLFRYMLACGGRKGSPIKFNGSIFTYPYKGDPDFRQWGPGYWWQNQRLIYWPMMACGDFDLMEPFFKMYRDIIPLAKARTKTYFGHGGMHFLECQHFWGSDFNRNYGWDRKDKHVSYAESPWVKRYWQGGLEMTAIMLDYYAYTEDKDFLKDTLLPFATEIVEFYDQHYERDTNDKILFAPAQSLETWWDSVNPMPEIAGLKFNLTNLLELPKNTTTKAHRRKWKRMLGELPDIPTREIEGKTVLAAAGSFKDKNNCENPELYAAFPYRLYGMGKDDLKMGRLAFEHRLHRERNMGHNQDAAHAAYLGLTDQVREFLVSRLGSSYQVARFPTMWHGGYDWMPDHCHGGVGMIALQAMLMQCEDEKILLFPTWPKDWDVNFKLLAPYNTTVEGVYKDGKLQDLKVTPESRTKDVVLFKEDKTKALRSDTDIKLWKDIDVSDYPGC